MNFQPHEINRDVFDHEEPVDADVIPFKLDVTYGEFHLSNEVEADLCGPFGLWSL